MLRFYLGRIPVSLHFSFLLLLYIAYAYTQDLADAVVAGLGIFAGVLLHEAGHALTARRFGASGVAITLFALGGVTTYQPPTGLSAGRRFLIAAAGSALAMAVALPVYLALRADLITDHTLRLVAAGFVVAGLLWGLLNWAPIRPLDGGQMMTSVLQIFFPREGATIAKVISAIFTAGAAFFLYRSGEEFFAFYVILIGAIGLRDPSETPRNAKPQPRAEAETDPPPSFPL